MRVVFYEFKSDKRNSIPQRFCNNSSNNYSYFRLCSKFGSEYFVGCEFIPQLYFTFCSSFIRFSIRTCFIVKVQHFNAFKAFLHKKDKIHTPTVSFFLFIIPDYSSLITSRVINNTSHIKNILQHFTCK